MARIVGQLKLLLGVMRRLNGTLPRDCPACGYHGRFDAEGMPPRFDVKCPRCYSLERHRLFVLSDRSMGLITSGAELLHIAPEAIVGRYLREKCKRYITLDLGMEGADVKEPIERTSFPDACFDHVFCSHVLEHVDDRRALRELHRILRPGGTALLMVPIVEGWDFTYENPDITSDFEREIHFGQNDHVRWYGRDFRQRISDAGFNLSEVTSERSDFVRYGLLKGEKIFIARKPPAPGA